MVTERITQWSRRFIPPRVNRFRVAHPHPLTCWNRYGGVPGTPYRGVTIGFAVMLCGHGLGVRWAKPVGRSTE